MSINKYNKEGYPDPTAYEALTSIHKEEAAVKVFRPLVFICSPYAGDIELNKKAARIYSHFAVERGYIPITPHLLYPQFLDDGDPTERKLGIRFGEILMDKCSEVWVFGSRLSEGMKSEVARAKRKGYPLRYFTVECEEMTKCP